jgi:hypothetical protein
LLAHNKLFAYQHFLGIAPYHRQNIIFVFLFRDIMISLSQNDAGMGISESSLPKDLYLLEFSTKQQQQQQQQQLHDEPFHHKNVPKPKHVRFLNSVTVRSTIARSDITQAELKSCWYSSGDYHLIRQKCHALVNLSCQNVNTSGSGSAVRFCTRGLESLFGSVMVERIAKRELVAWAIFDLQDAFGSAEDIAAVGHAVTKESAERAVAMGERDWKEAQRCLMSPWRRTHEQRR